MEFRGSAKREGQVIFQLSLRGTPREDTTLLPDRCRPNLALMSGHIHSEASSHECSLVRALAYDTPRLLDYSPQGVYRDSAPLGTWASTQRDYLSGVGTS